MSSDGTPQHRPQLEAGALSMVDFNFGIPTKQCAEEHVDEVHGKDSWRYRWLKKLHSHKFQVFLSCLLLLDVIILFVELFLLANYPPCHVIERDAISCCTAAAATDERFLAEEHHEFCELGHTSFEYDAACDEHKWEAVHTTEKVLFGVTAAILSVFFVELNMTMLALKPTIFFRQVFYTVDYIIVTVSLVMEITFHSLDDDVIQSLVGLLVLFRIWRFVRIGHGLVEFVSELWHEKYQKLLTYTEELEDLLRDKGVSPPDTESIRHLKHESGDSLVSSIEREKRRKHFSHHHTSSSGEAGDKDSK